MKTLNQQKLARITPPSNEFINFGGGMDVTSPPISANPGTVRDSQNWVVDTAQGYKRIIGYERFDGRPKPSDADYYVLNVTITGSIDVGDTITGVTSGETAYVAAVVTTGTPDYLVLTKVSGTFTSDEDLNVSAVKEGEAIGLPILNGASTNLLNAQYRNLVADVYRNDITAITGSGPVRGVFVLDDVTYAFRDNAGATSCDLWKSSTSGWTQVSYQEEISFTGADANVDEGDTLTQGGVTATIDRIMFDGTGTFPTSYGGKLIISSRAGGSFSAGAATSTGGGNLTISGAESAITMSSGGKFEVVVQNFSGATGTKRAYGCDGTNRGWEFDGTVFAPIDTGLTTDTPTHCIEHKYHLFFAFGSSAQHSGPGTPYIWSPVYGAAELAVGDDITGFSQEGGGNTGTAGEGALAIVSRNKTHVLYGNTVDDWNLIPYRDELGGYEWTIQQLGSTIMLDDRGVTSMITSDRYGNFEHSTLSRLVREWVAARRTLVKDSCVSREYSQYRLFFESGIALFATMDGEKVLGMMPQQLKHNVESCWSSELNDGSEISLIGSDTGYVYEFDKGTSFDGENIEHYFNLHFTHLNSPHTDKEYYGGFFEVTGLGYSAFNFTYELGYASTDVPQPSTFSKEVSLSQALWDQFTWDAFYWDGKTLLPSSFELSGRGENISLIIQGNSDYDWPIKFSGALIQFRPRVGFRYTNNG